MYSHRAFDFLPDIFDYLEKNEIEKSQLVCVNWNRAIVFNKSKLKARRRRIFCLRIYRHVLPRRSNVPFIESIRVSINLRIFQFLLVHIYCYNSGVKWDRKKKKTECSRNFTFTS